MRVLLLAGTVYAERANGAAQSTRTVLEWLAEAGVSCRAVTAGVFEQSAACDLEAHHEALGVMSVLAHPGPSPVRRSMLGGVDVTVIDTGGVPDPEAENLVIDTFFDAVDDQPDVVLAYGSHLAVHMALAHARARGVRTIFAVHGLGYDDRRYFASADRVLLPSAHLARALRTSIGLRADQLPAPLRWTAIRAPEEARAFLTFINPALHKGCALFARLADMLGRQRPDIPILIVQSAAGAAVLAQTPGLDLGRYANILVSPADDDVRHVYALTRVLLVPSAFAEPFGRVAAEAMINGIPPLVSDRGALPDTVAAGGQVITLPPWMTATSTRVPDEAEAQPWFDAVVRLWDDRAAYAMASAAARAEAGRLYDEDTTRRRYLEYFSDAGPFRPLFDD